NQSQQPNSLQPWGSRADTSATSGTGSGSDALSGTESATGVTSFASSAPLQSLLSLLGPGDGTIASSVTGTAVGANDTASAGAAPPNPNTSTGGGLTLAGGTDAASTSSGVHGGHHHHHGGFAIQSQSDSSDPLANLLGTSAPGTSSTT